MRGYSFCLFSKAAKAAIFSFLVVQLSGRFTEFDKSAFFLLYYMVHVVTQNLESRNHTTQVLPVAGGGVGPQSPLPVFSVALRPGLWV